MTSEFILGANEEGIDQNRIVVDGSLVKRVVLPDLWISRMEAPFLCFIPTIILPEVHSSFVKIEIFFRL